jgi:hypothetical protein
MHLLKKMVWALFILVLLPSAAFAQATLAGVAKDASGAVLPGVTVEASSEALIEKTRSAITDGTGQYQIVDLRPGTYVVTFTLTGFATVKREAVTITGVGTITVNADMKVGNVSETVNVSGEAPVVDVQSSKRQAVIDSGTLRDLPSARSPANLLASIPALTGSAVTQSSATPTFVAFFSAHGGPANEGNIQIDSLPVGAAFNGGGTSGNAYDTFNAQELQITVSGSLGEAETGGPILNILPKTGGNRFKGQAFYTQAGKKFQWNNIDSALLAQGITQAGLINLWDYNFALGGPIKKDRAWFYVNYRDVGSHTAVPGQYANLYAGDASHWDYAPNLAVPARGATSRTEYSGRLDAQVTPRNKVSYRYDFQKDCDGTSLSLTEGCRKMGSNFVGSNAFSLPFVSPEADSNYWDDHEVVQTATWTSPVTNKLLLDAGFSSFNSHWGWTRRPGDITNLVQVTQIVPFLETYRSRDNIIENYQDPLRWRASASYVTGAHNMKFGYTAAYNIEETSDLQSDPGFTITNLSFVLPGLYTATLRIAPWNQSHRTWSNGIYAQDQWTLKKVTLQGAVRYDRASSFFPAAGNGSPGNKWTNFQPITFPETKGVDAYNDISYRGGVTWDVRGDGKTSLKVFAGKYLQNADNQANYIANAPSLDGVNGRPGPNFQTRATRTYIDFNGNHVPDCPGFATLNAPNGECIAPDLGNFGQLGGLTTTDPNVLKGWGVRPYDTQINVSIQQQVLPRTSVEFGYYRRSFYNFFVTDNLNLAASDFQTYTFNAPTDPRLGSTSGQPVSYVIPKPNVNINNIRNLYTSVGAITGNDSDWSNYWHGFDFTVTARGGHGLSVNFGTSTGRSIQDNCAVTAKVPEMQNFYLTTGNAGFSGFSNGIFNLASSCRKEEDWQTSARGFVTYIIPKADVLISAIVRSSLNSAFGFGSTPEGNSTGLSANIAQVPYPTIPTAPAGYGFNMYAPGKVYSDRVNITDVRFGKIVNYKGTRMNFAIDLLNLFNTNTATGFQQNFGATFMSPTAIVSARVAKINITVDF